MAEFATKDVRFLVQQADATIDLAPASGTKYPLGVFSATQAYVRIKSVSAIVTFTVQPDPLEIHLVIDGVTHIFAFTNPVTATNYYLETINADRLPTTQYLTVNVRNQPFIIEGKSVTELSAEITGGTVSNMKARAKWARHI